MRVGNIYIKKDFATSLFREQEEKESSVGMHQKLFGCNYRYASDVVLR